ncbi:hypothetical protein [Nocardia sp. CA-120079]
MAQFVLVATNGYDRHGREIGVADMRGTISRMNAAEEKGWLR